MTTRSPYRARRIPGLAALLGVACLALPATAAAVAPSAANPFAALPDCHREPSQSFGTPGHGRVEHAVLFPATGPDHFAWNFREQRIGGSDRTRWGDCRVVRAVLHGLASYRDRSPDAPLVAVGDMGLRHGGPIDGHATHQNGRQIDLYYPRRDRRRREPHTVAQVDMRLARRLVGAMLDAGAQRVLVGPHIRIRTSSRVMRWPNHDDHLHAIF
jgi:murein endopeptidase